MIIQSTKNYGHDQLKILVYGPPGVGKTTLATTCSGKALIISAESGLLSLAGSDIDFIDVTHSETGEKLTHKEIWENVSSIPKKLDSAKYKETYDWIFLDSLTEMSQICVRYMNDEFESRKDSYVMWGEYTKAMHTMIKDFRDLQGYNVVFTALPKIDKDEVGQRHTIVDIAGSQLQNFLPAFFDEVFYYDIRAGDDEKPGRRLITGYEQRLIAKDRSGKLNKFEKPDLTNIQQKITGGKNGKT